MNDQFKAIETRYKGYRFRSRLEARWAVFFDALDISWEYEPEGYDLGDGLLYLPDFWLPQVNKWAEVKPELPWIMSDEVTKMVRLAWGARHGCLMLDGLPDLRPYWFIEAHVSFESDLPEIPPARSPAANYGIREGWEQLHGLGLACDCFLEPDYLDEGRFYSCVGGWDWDKAAENNWGFSKFYIAAVEKARAARFEHGEKP